MENVLKLIVRGNPETVRASQETKTGEQRRKELLEELREVHRRLACNEAWFQLETDEDLVEACVYERQSLLAQGRSLFERAKKEHVQCAPFL